MVWRYFGRTAGSGQTFEVYRYPANGKPLHHQDDDDVFRIVPGRTWERVGRSILIGDMVSGWFSEKKDEMSEVDALALIDSWKNAAEPDW